MNSLSKIALDLLPHLVVINPDLAADDAVEWAYELAAAFAIKTAELEDGKTSWAHDYHAKFGGTLP